MRWKQFFKPLLPFSVETTLLTSRKPEPYSKQKPVEAENEMAGFPKEHWLQSTALRHNVLKTGSQRSAAIPQEPKTDALSCSPYGPPWPPQGSLFIFKVSMQSWISRAEKVKLCAAAGEIGEEE